tara:strand:+ start:364 stop:513 length:150 start_codon:yes stop_codon:yes gene_type:complete
MIHNSDMNFSNNMNGRLKQMTSMDIVVVVRPAAVDVSESISFLGASNIS